MRKKNEPTPVHLLSGFLGSGKTTLLAGMLSHFKDQGLKPAVIMNELGEVNLDGELVDREVPMAEMLSGCICCSIRGDLGVEIGALIETHHPDVIIIESTGAANPLETIDGITDASMYQTIALRSVITVVDGHELLERSKSGKGRTFKLMKEQIQCATMLVLNKSDKLDPESLVEAQQLLREMNGHAPIIAAVRCGIQDWSWLASGSAEALLVQPGATDHSTQDDHHHDGSHHNQHQHHSHDHVMVATYYMDKPVSQRSVRAASAQLAGQYLSGKRHSDLLGYIKRQPLFVPIRIS